MKNILRKVAALVMGATLTFGLCACNSGAGSSSGNSGAGTACFFCSREISES